MVKIRLKRLGCKGNPFYRVVVINSREKREGRAIAELGNYNPKTKELNLDKIEVAAWIKKGAQPSDTAKYLIDNSDENGKLIIKEKPSKAERKAKKEAEAAKIKAEEEAKAAAEAAKKEAAEAKKAEAEAAAAAKAEAEAATTEETTEPTVEA